MKVATNDRISELQEISNKLDERIKCYDDFRQSESDFGRFMRSRSIADVIPIEQIAQFVMIDGMIYLEAFSKMYFHLSNWKELVDKKITELKDEEFPNEIIL